MTVDAHRDLSAGGHGAGTARITGGGWSPGATARGVAAGSASPSMIWDWCRV